MSRTTILLSQVILQLEEYLNEFDLNFEKNSPEYQDHLDAMIDSLEDSGYQIVKLKLV